MTTFIDTNVLLCMLNPAETMHQWSIKEFQNRKLKGPVIVSDIVYCEFSVGMASKTDVDVALSRFAVERISGNDEVLFRAGKAFKQYKSNKGQKLNVLPDFLIGALAEVMSTPLLTANQKDMLKYFPKIEVICPSTASS